MTIRRLSALGFVAVAVLGLAAIWVSGASAFGERFHTEIEPTVLTGANVGEDTFTVGTYNVHCKATVVSGTWASKTVESMTLHPTYTGCTDSKGVAAGITTTGCNLVYWSELLGGDAKVEVECEGKQEIKIGVGTCTIKIAGQVNPLGATYANGTFGAEKVPDITVKSTFEAAFTTEGVCKEVVGKKGTFTGSTTVEGYVDECAAGACPFAPGGMGDKDGYKEGNIIGISWK